MVNWLVVGVGDITSKRVIPAILAEPRSRLYGILTRDPAKVSPYGVKAFTDLQQALRDPAIHAAYVATPVFLHAPQTLAALAAGKHVLSEKPMAMNYGEAQSMVKAAARAGKTLGVAYYRRFYPKLQRARELLAQGVIGQPVLAWATCHDEIPAKQDHRRWLLDPRQAGGGPLYDIASHRIDALNYLFGEPVGATAHLSNAVHLLDVEDNATVMIEYKSRVRALVDVRWHSEVRRDEFRIIGTGGEIECTPLNGPRLAYPGGSENLPVAPNVHLPLIRAFVDAVLDGAPLSIRGEAAAWTDWITERALTGNRSSAPARPD